ncbi:MAG: outer membrane lipoprotein-sorting protein [Flavobacteriales bacterium MED-G15]|nr:MAG: outer membrane lipoprotein-sorting protein [Flavobacteriales bacterium MED-G15]|tara:strand:- start:43 stop:813 length:771 start_codon:yes stop_codon:yes gene_type:complete
MKNIIFSLFLTLPLLLSAQTDEEKGAQIVAAAIEADRGFGSSTVDLKMVLKNKNGQISERTLSNKTLELDEDGDKSMIVFTSPKDIKGTSTLTFTHKVGADDQWLFLPSIQRTKRISSSNKSGPFVGSEFAYEDLSSVELEKNTYKFLKQEGDLLYVEQDPVDPKSGYKKRIAVYNKAKDYRLEEIEFYDRKGALLKTLTYTDYKLYKDKFWRANKFEMVNHQSKKETLLFFNNYNFEVNLKEGDFTEIALRRASN